MPSRIGNDLKKPGPPLAPNRAQKLPPALIGAIGHIITSKGEKLYLFTKSDGIQMLTITFKNKKAQVIGHAIIVPKNLLLNYFYVEPNFRGNSYLKEMVATVLEGARKAVFTKHRTDSLYIYIQNPLLVKTFKRHGFESQPNVPGMEEKPSIVITLSSKKTQRKISLYAEKAGDRETLRKKTKDPDNLDWHIFEVVDHPIEGEEMVIFSTYYVKDSGLFHQALDQSKIQFCFYARQ